MSNQAPLLSDSSLEESFSAILKSITDEIEVAMGNTKRVEVSCARLRKQLETHPSLSYLEHLLQLLPLLKKRSGPIVTPLSDLFDEVALTADDPWPFLKGMLAARDRKLVLRALKRLLYLTESGLFSVDLRVIKFLAGRVEMEGCPLGEPEYLATVGKIVKHLALPGSQSRQNPLIALYLQEKDNNQRRMAARLLDLQEIRPQAICRNRCWDKRPINCSHPIWPLPGPHI